MALSAFRGYANKLLFKGFPADLRWVRVVYAVGDLGGMKYGNHTNWVNLSNGSRLVRDGAANIEPIQVAGGINQSMTELERAIARGQTCRELIVAAETEESVPVIVEGHTRATAYLRALKATTEVEAIMGLSPRISEWHWW